MTTFRRDRGDGAQGLGLVAKANAGVELDVEECELYGISFFGREIFAEQLQ
jgi:hypothetical protein